MAALTRRQVYSPHSIYQNKVPPCKDNDLGDLTEIKPVGMNTVIEAAAFIYCDVQQASGVFRKNLTHTFSLYKQEVT